VPTTGSEGVVIVVVAQIPAAGIEQFRAYERAVLSLLGEHGGELQRRLCSADALTEVHLVSFPTLDAFTSYRNDPRREGKRALLGGSEPRFEVYELGDAPLEELLG
jgi:hypothetical protein